MEIFGINAIGIVLLCGLLCAGAFVFSFLFSALDIVFEILGAVIGFSLDIFNAGPVPGCGCVALLLLIIGCAGCGLWFSDAISSCGTSDAVILCRFV